jgi:hypothetical protein
MLSKPSDKHMDKKKDPIAEFRRENQKRVSAKNARTLLDNNGPSIIADNLPFLGGLVKTVIQESGYHDMMYTRLMQGLLISLSELVDKEFALNSVLLDAGGLASKEMMINGNKYVISKAVAAWLHSVADENSETMSKRNLVLALLHERLWQCKDSHPYQTTGQRLEVRQAMLSYENNIDRLLELAKTIQHFTLSELGKSDKAKEIFTEKNGGNAPAYYLSSQHPIHQWSEMDRIKLIALQLTPFYCLQEYMKIFSSPSGNKEMLFIPYVLPHATPSKTVMPPPERVMVADTPTSSPGLAVDNVVFINSYRNRKTLTEEKLDWIVGKEMFCGYLNPSPPFDYYLMFEQSPHDLPEWAVDREPDIAPAHARWQYDPKEYILSDMESTWEEYQESGKGLSIGPDG